MTRTSFNLTNKTEKPFLVQIDPFADLLHLAPGERVCLAIYSENSDIEIDVYEDEGLKNIWIPQDTEYFFVEGDLEIDHFEYGSNVDDWGGPLHEKSSLKSRISYREVNPRYYEKKNT